MKVSSEKDGGTEPRLGHLEKLLQELTRCEERKRQQSVESASASTRQKLLNDQLQQTQEELTAAQTSRAKLCEEIGTLKQTKVHQAKQLDTYKRDLQTLRESQAAMTKKMEEMEAATWTAKQQYIRSLASRIKTSALVLQQLDIPNETSSRAQLAEKCNGWEKGNPNKRQRIHGDEKENKAPSEPEHAGSAVVSAVSSHVSGGDNTTGSAALVGVVTAPTSTNAVALVKQLKALSSTSDTKLSEQQEKDNAQKERALEELQSQVTKLKTEYSGLKDKYTALVREHDEVLADSKASAQDIKAKESKIEELMQMLEIAGPKERESSTVEGVATKEDSSAAESRLKMLEENLAQMNGYADQLEVVIAQCPSCTIKLQSESTQDSIASRAE